MFIEVRQINALNIDGMWYWNDSITLATIDVPTDSDYAVIFEVWIAEHTPGIKNMIDTGVLYMCEEEPVVEVRYKKNDEPVLAGIVVGD